MSNEIFKVSNEDIRLLCDFMGIKPVVHGPNSYSWRDGVFYSTHEESSEKVMANVWIYIGERKVRDWNFLMEIVLKVRGLGYPIDINYGDLEGGIKENWYDLDRVVSIGSVPNPCVSVPPTEENPVYVREFNDPKEALYNLLVRFVKWYNSKNSSNERV
ncbi:MAG: hypothetical protein WAT79_08410 [Saprospiraceae bacterium]